MRGKNLEELFSGIANIYDLLNHLLSFNTDRLWRRKLVRIAGINGKENVLDICTGTGDIAIGFARKGAKVTGVDFSLPMLERANKKIDKKKLHGKIQLVHADALCLPFRDKNFDVVTIGFGLRNLKDKEKGFAEMTRVLKNHGRAFILEFSPPSASLFERVYSFYLRKILPFIGRAVSGNRQAYTYLSDSVKDFLSPQEVINIMDEFFREVSYLSLTGGVANIYIGIK